MRKLFLSFTRLLNALRDGKVSDEDLVKGLYCFDATERYVRNPWITCDNDVEHVFKNDLARGKEVHGKIVRMVEAAQREGRIDWRKFGEDHAAESVSAMFTRNGFPPFQTSLAVVNAGSIREWVDENKIQLEIP